MSYKFLPIPANTDPAQQLAMINKNFAELDNQAATSLFKIVKILNFSITQPASSSTSYSKPHGLGYAPAVMGFLAAGGGIFQPLPARTSLTLDNVNHQVTMNTWVEVQSDATNISIIFWNGNITPAGNYNFKVYVLEESSS